MIIHLFSTRQFFYRMIANVHLTIQARNWHFVLKFYTASNVFEFMLLRPLTHATGFEKHL